MDRAFSHHDINLLHNPHAILGAPYGDRQRRFTNVEGTEGARREIIALPGYKSTPLCDLGGLARIASIARLWYKDEGGRFGLGSFKALGGAYAVFLLLKREIERRAGRAGISATDLIEGRYRDVASTITVTCATDGKHGRVAR